ncbi:MAG: NADH:ubiquinone reductase (Na(+)-transporting) subunit F, partial [Phycisphaerae bacterium]
MILLAAIVLLVALLAALAAGLILAERWLIYTGPCQIHINGGELIIDTQAGQSLLQALLDSEIYLPSSCGGQGTCGLCKLRAISGAGPLLPTEQGFLSRHEVQQGQRLACQIKLRGDVEISLPEQILNVTMYQATVVHVQDHSPTLREIHLQLPAEADWPYQPGQYIQIEAPSPDGTVFRAYSPCPVTEDSLRLAMLVRLVPGGIGSTYLHSLTIGQQVRFTGPYGQFDLQDDPDAAIICVGGGCGLASIRSIVDAVCQRWPHRHVQMFYGCRSPQEAVWMDHFTALAETNPGFQFLYALSDTPPANWTGPTGQIHHILAQQLPPAPDAHAFLCGPEPMIQAVRQT